MLRAKALLPRRPTRRLPLLPRGGLRSLFGASSLFAGVNFPSRPDRPLGPSLGRKNRFESVAPPWASKASQLPSPASAPTGKPEKAFSLEGAAGLARKSAAPLETPSKRSPWPKPGRLSLPAACLDGAPGWPVRSPRRRPSPRAPLGAAGEGEAINPPPPARPGSISAGDPSAAPPPPSQLPGRRRRIRINHGELI